jgi:hypothetical protein
VLVLVALLLPVLLGMFAVVLDGSNLMVQHRSMQNAADAAALAAAPDLAPALDPTCASDPVCLGTVRTKAVNDAAKYSAMNGGPATLALCLLPSDTNCYRWPYNGDNGRIEIRLKKSISASIAGAVGMASLSEVHGRAVSSAHPVMSPGTPLAIFAYAHRGVDGCGNRHGVTVNGNPATSIDAVVSNGSVTMNSSGSLAYAGYGAPPLNCPKAGSNQANAATWQKETALLDWPRTFNRASVCTGHDSNVQVNLDSPVDGVYCSTVGIKLTGLGGGRTYHLTLIAPVIDIPSTNNHFTLAPDNADLDASNKELVLWQNGPGQDFSFNHNNSDVNGVIWIENGDLAYIGNSGTTGFYEAQNISIDGNSYVMRGEGPPVGSTIVGANVGLDE